MANVKVFEDKQPLIDTGLSDYTYSSDDMINFRVQKVCLVTLNNFRDVDTLEVSSFNHESHLMTTRITTINKILHLYYTAILQKCDRITIGTS